MSKKTEDKQKRIWLPYGNAKKIAKVFDCSVQFVSYSLSGVKTSELAKKIRHTALTQYKGVEINN